MNMNQGAESGKAVEGRYTCQQEHPHDFHRHEAVTLKALSANVLRWLRRTEDHGEVEEIRTTQRSESMEAFEGEREDFVTDTGLDP